MINTNPSPEYRYHQSAGKSVHPTLECNPFIQIPSTVVARPLALPTALDRICIVPKLLFTPIVLSTPIDFTVSFLPTSPKSPKQADCKEADEKEHMIDEAEKSLKVEQTRARDIIKGLEDGKSWNPGGSKTTGICAAYACKAVDHVIQFGEQESLPPLVVGAPPKEMQFLVMKLVQSIYQSLRNREKYEDAKLDADGQQLFNRSILKFIHLLRGQTGLEAVNRYPAGEAGSFTDSHNIADVTQLIDEISKKDQGKHHFLFFRNPGEHLTEGHVVYVNFEKGIIGDGADGTMWKIPATCKEVFSQVLVRYIKENYEGSFKNVSAIVVNKSFNPRKFPLALRKIRLYSSLFYHITKREGIKAACAYTILPALEKLQERGKKAKENAKKKMIKVADVFRVRFGAQDSKQRILDKACRAGDIATMRLALKWGANPSLPYNNIFPLSAAVESRNMEAIRLLVRAGANLNPHPPDHIEDPFWDDLASPLSRACYCHFPQAVEFLLSQGAVPKASHLVSACSRTWTGDIDIGDARVKILQMLLEKGVDPNDPILQVNRRYPLEEAVERSDLQAVQLLLKYKAKPSTGLCEAVMNWNNTRDQTSCDCRLTETQVKANAKQIALLLIEAGADITKLNDIWLPRLQKMMQGNTKVQETIAEILRQRQEAESQTSTTLEGPPPLPPIPEDDGPPPPPPEGV